MSPRLPLLFPSLLVALALLASAGDARAVERETTTGPVSVRIELLPDAPRIGDPLTLHVEVTAEPEVEVLMPAFGEALDRFAIVDFAPSESVDDSGRTVSSQRYTLQASRSGRLSVPPLLVEFVDRRPGRDPAPEGLDAFEVLTERLEVEVASVLAADEPLTLRPVRGELGELTAPRDLWPLGVLLALLLSLAPFAIRRYRQQLDARRRESAYDVAKRALDTLLHSARPGPEEMDGFFVDLSAIVRRYLEDRFELRSPELTTEEFISLVSASPDLSGGHQQLLRAFLERADLVKFARHVPDERGVEESIRAAERFLEETRTLEEELAATDAAAEPTQAALG
jgi:hypothetical protein